LRWCGDRIFLRIYEATGQAAEGTVTVPARVVGWCEADGVEKATSPQQACDRMIPFKLRPFEARGFLLSVR
jgi:hypothetical protein